MRIPRGALPCDWRFGTSVTLLVAAMAFGGGVERPPAPELESSPWLLTFEDGPAGFLSTQWSRTTDPLLFSRTPGDGSFDVGVVTPRQDGSVATNLLVASGEAGSAHWSPSGDRIALVRWQGVTRHVTIVDVGTGPALETIWSPGATFLRHRSPSELRASTRAGSGVVDGVQTRAHFAVAK